MFGDGERQICKAVNMRQDIVKTGFMAKISMDFLVKKKDFPYCEKNVFFDKPPVV
jgi:hypothetical protein